MTPLQAAIRALSISVALAALLVFTLVGIGHDPRPNDLPVAITKEDRDFYAALVELGFSPTTVADREEGRELVLERDVYAFIELTRPLLVAGAASVPVVDELRAVFSPRGAVEDVRPLDEDDPHGITIELTLLALVVASSLAGLLSSVLAPRLDRRRRLGVLALFGLLGGVGAMLVVQLGTSALPGSLLALSGVAALGMFGIATATSVLVRWLGTAGGGVLSLLLFLMLGYAASGAASAPELLPDPWSWAGQLLPPGALATGLRNVAYFDAAEASRWLLVLLAWTAAGTAALAATPPARPAT